MNDRSRPVWLAVFAAALFTSAVGSNPADRPRCRPAISTKYSQNAPVTKADHLAVETNCKFGLPRQTVRPGDLPTRYVFRPGYVLEHSSELRIPLWVCERITMADLQGKFRERLKPEPFRRDPLLAGFPSSEPKDYRRSGFARGHMAPDADRTTKAAKADTYFLSNIVPQAGKRFNSGIWLKLEKCVREWVLARGTCWVITGGFIHDPAEDDEQTADGVVEYFTIGNNSVGVPTHLFKIVLAERPPAQKAGNASGASAWEALAFVFENKSYKPGIDLERSLRSIDWIEERTGFDFFAELDDDLEEEVESKPAPAIWPFDDQ